MIAQIYSTRKYKKMTKKFFTDVLDQSHFILMFLIKFFLWTKKRKFLFLQNACFFFKDDMSNMSFGNFVPSGRNLLLLTYSQEYLKTLFFGTYVSKDIDIARFMQFGQGDKNVISFEPYFLKFSSDQFQNSLNIIYKMGIKWKANSQV